MNVRTCEQRKKPSTVYFAGATIAQGEVDRYELYVASRIKEVI